MKRYYEKDINGVVIAIHYEETMGDNTGTEITSPLMDNYTAHDGRGIPRWKEVSIGVIELRTQVEIDADYIPPAKTGNDYFNAIMAGLTEQEQTDFLDVYDEFPTFGLLLRHKNPQGAKNRLDAAESAGMLTAEEVIKIKGLMDGA